MRLLIAILLVALTGCASQPTPTYTKVIPQMTWQQAATYQLNCNDRDNQLAVMQDQLKSRTFYTVDGVDGNEEPNRISKRFTAHVKMKIWQLRLNCPDSRFNDYKPKMVDVSKHSMPKTEVRCYYKDTHRVKQDGDDIVTKSDKSEVCTNQPLVTDIASIKTGNIVIPEQLKPFYPIRGYRKWHNHIYQMAMVTEAHNGQAVGFVVVVVEREPGIWQVVDKF